MSFGRDTDKRGNKLFHAVQENNLKPVYQDMEYTIPTLEDMQCEAQLSALGVWEPLSFHISGWDEDVKKLEDWWVPFQPKKGILNDRESVLVMGPEGCKPSDPCGLAQLAKIYGFKPNEDSMSFATEAKDAILCLSEVFEYFDFGRSFVIRLNSGGHYPPHRDHILLTRPTFRLIAFLGDSTGQLRWEVEDKLVHVEPNHVYYVDTRKTHRLWSAGSNSDMVVFNVVKNWTNVMKLMTMLKYQG